ncbi:fasciclin domain-containing protein [Geodermatophilus marinus]|uniref:fasciclin domain-containing protein n=1 Tax=Geodermatophilus sp. LHW52908 TaxID=2303986 RepID=UPI000E3D0A91|nr:fasciclin domain-containing protein [Geodermatophilus sp. LHW52908]RFU23165.1 fasciclin domain-containing protein [Geodermatophilus sp. LHW52908]
MTRTPARTGLLALAATLALTLPACGSDGTTGTASRADDGATSSSTATATGAGGSTDGGTGGGTGGGTASAGPFGEGCAALPADGEGSLAGMADDPVATAASNNPVLITLVQALQAANLVDTFNTTEDITVLAPANPAFEAVPQDRLAALLADTPQLTAVLTHHVIPGRLAPDELAGTHATLNDDEVTVEGSGEEFTIGGDGTLTGTEASVVCGDVQTANATVYVIDGVLAPAGS